MRFRVWNEDAGESTSDVVEHPNANHAADTFAFANDEGGSDWVITCVKDDDGEIRRFKTEFRLESDTFEI